MNSRFITILFLALCAAMLAAAPRDGSYNAALDDESSDSLLVVDAEEVNDSVDIEEVFIMGRPELSIDRMYHFVKSRNPNFLYDIAETFYVIGERYGIRGDIALCQAVLETGWFRFMDGTAVTPDQYNFGGLGVTKLGETGNAFTTLEEGVTAMMQHLYAYACPDALPAGEPIVDVRFGLVKRGCAPTWEKLSGRWAMNDHYGADILRIYGNMERFELPDDIELDDNTQL